MDRSRAIILPLLAVVAAALATGSSGCANGPVSSAFPEAVAEILAGPDAVEIFALHPYPHDEGPEYAGAPRLWGYRILGSADVPDAGDRRRIVELVSQGIDSSDGNVAACFDPRHGIRAVRGAETVELVICYECLQLDVHGPGEARVDLLTSRKPERALTALFERHGLRVAGAHD